MNTTQVKRIPSDWGMFSGDGNRSLTAKAEGLIKKLEKAISPSQVDNALKAYLRSYRRMSSTKTMSEASDTAVREGVWGFFLKVCYSYGLSHTEADNLWEHCNSYPERS